MKNRKRIVKLLSLVAKTSLEQEKNERKGDDWAKLTDAQLFNLMNEEMNELWLELIKGDRQRVLEEAGDVAAYLAMLIDNNY